MRLCPPHCPYLPDTGLDFVEIRFAHEPLLPATVSTTLPTLRDQAAIILFWGREKQQFLTRLVVGENSLIFGYHGRGCPI